MNQNNVYLFERHKSYKVFFCGLDFEAGANKVIKLRVLEPESRWFYVMKRKR